MTPEELRAAHCWFAVDHCPGEPATTDWKRRARLHQATWREKRHYPIGTQPYKGGPSYVGSRLNLLFAEEKGENFLSENLRTAVRHRLSYHEKHEMIREARLWADLLSSMPLCFNLFGDLYPVGQGPSPDRAANAVARWWSDAPAGDVSLLFEHSPGRLDPLYLNNRSAFDAAFDITRNDGSHGLIGIETKYHEHPKREPIPRVEKLTRYTEVTERSNAFVSDWRDYILGTHLQQIWLDHLLLLSALQHPTKAPTWGRFVLVYPSANPAFARLATEYTSVLTDPSTYEARTIESILDTPGALPVATVNAFRERYLL